MRTVIAILVIACGCVQPELAVQSDVSAQATEADSSRLDPPTSVPEDSLCTMNDQGQWECDGDGGGGGGDGPGGGDPPPACIASCDPTLVWSNLYCKSTCANSQAICASRWRCLAGDSLCDSHDGYCYVQ